MKLEFFSSHEKANELNLENYYYDFSTPFSIKKIHEWDYLKSRRSNFPEPVLPPKDLVLLKGKLTEYNVVFVNAPFNQESYQIDKNKEDSNGKKLIASFFATLNFGIGGLLALNPRKKVSYPSGYIVAKMDDLPLRGYIGFSKFNISDDVEVVAEKHDTHYQVYAMKNIQEKKVALVPLCSRGHRSTLRYYIRNLILVSFIIALITWFFSGFIRMNKYAPTLYLSMVREFEHSIAWFFFVLFIGSIVTIKMYRLSRFTNILLSERIFKIFGWKDVNKISLAKISRAIIKKRQKSGEYPKRWEDKDFGIFPYKKMGASCSGFFYYDEKLLK